jgi:hypothetical protein
VELLCRILSSEINTFTDVKKITADQMQALVLLAKKYFCLKNVQLIVSVWMHQLGEIHKALIDPANPNIEVLACIAINSQDTEGSILTDFARYALWNSSRSFSEYHAPYINCSRPNMLWGK